jgi:hypothetical protein
MKKTIPSILLCAGLALTLSSCATSQNKLLETDSSQLELRKIQSRSFDTGDAQKTLRSVIATLQDLGFVVDKSDSNFGTVTATKLSGYNLTMTVTIRQVSPKSVTVRANAQFNLKAISKPEPYQNFFTSLSKSMFLDAHEVD